jgi:hypothetical protein
MKLPRLVIVALSAALALVCVPGTAAASDSSDVMATVNHALAAFNRGDLKTWAAACASSSSIVDDFAPYEWQGPTACTDWATAYAAFSKKAGITAGVVTLGAPRHVAVGAGRAYLVFPATYTYKQKGKPMKQSGAVFTLALAKTGAGWQITGWAWADPPGD